MLIPLPSLPLISSLQWRDVTTVSECPLPISFLFLRFVRVILSFSPLPVAHRCSQPSSSPSLFSQTCRLSLSLSPSPSLSLSLRACRYLVVSPIDLRALASFAALSSSGLPCDPERLSRVPSLLPSLLRSDPFTSLSLPSLFPLSLPQARIVAPVLSLSLLFVISVLPLPLSPRSPSPSSLLRSRLSLANPSLRSQDCRSVVEGKRRGKRGTSDSLAIIVVPLFVVYAFILRIRGKTLGVWEFLVASLSDFLYSLACFSSFLTKRKASWSFVSSFLFERHFFLPFPTSLSSRLLQFLLQIRYQFDQKKESPLFFLSSHKSFPSSDI